MQEIRLLAIDLDGTLVNSKNGVSEENALWIRKAVERGVRVCIATGRSSRSALILSEQLGLNSPVISSNGAVTEDKNGIIRQYLLDDEIAFQCMQMLFDNGVYFLIPTGGVRHCLDVDCYGKRRNIYYQTFFPELSNYELKWYSDPKRLFEAAKGNILKIFIIEKSEKIPSVIDLINSNFDLSVTSSWFDYVDINAKHVSKGNAVREMALEYGIDMQNVLAIGDSYNDLSMLKAAGISVAAGNSGDEIKREAAFTGPCCDDDAVAWAIRKFIFKDRQL